MVKATKKAEIEVKPEAKEVKLSDSELLWEQIRKMHLSIFGLTQKVEENAMRVEINIPNQLHLKLKSQAALPAIETLLTSLNDGYLYEFEWAANIMIIKRSKA